MPGVAEDEPIFQNPPMSSRRSAEEMVNGTDKPEPKQAPQPDMSQAVEIAKAQVLAGYAADPEISRILQARASGKKVAVVDPDEAPNRIAQQEEVDWNNLDNKQLVEKIPTLLGPSLEAMMKKYVEPLTQTVGQLQGSAQQQQSEKVVSSIAAAKEKFTDFEDYRKSMIGLNAQVNPNGTLSVEDLYYLAKARAGDFNNAVVEPTSTARPSQVAARPSLSSQRKQALPNGRRGMSQLLDEALSRTDFTSLGDQLEG